MGLPGREGRSLHAFILSLLLLLPNLSNGPREWMFYRKFIIWCDWDWQRVSKLWLTYHALKQIHLCCLSLTQQGQERRERRISRLFTPISSASWRNSQCVYQSYFKSSLSASRKGNTEICGLFLLPWDYKEAFTKYGIASGSQRGKNPSFLDPLGEQK